MKRILSLLLVLLLLFSAGCKRQDTDHLISDEVTEVSAQDYLDYYECSYTVTVNEEFGDKTLTKGYFPSLKIESLERSPEELGYQIETVHRNKADAEKTFSTLSSCQDFSFMQLSYCVYKVKDEETIEYPVLPYGHIYIANNQYYDYRIFAKYIHENTDAPNILSIRDFANLPVGSISVTVGDGFSVIKFFLTSGGKKTLLDIKKQLEKDERFSEVWLSLDEEVMS